jgi:anthranilate synthase
VAPALQIEGKGLNFSINPLNERGQVLATIIRSYLSKSDHLFALTSESSDKNIVGHIIPSNQYFAEEERSKQASLFSLIREITSIFKHPDSSQLGLYGSFGYDLTFQFEEIMLKKDRDPKLRDLVLYFPDEILIIDNQKNDAWKIKYDFTDSKSSALSTIGKLRTVSRSPYQAATEEQVQSLKKRDGVKGDYAQKVVKAKEQFRLGNLFEVVLSQSFREKLTKKPSEIFKR